MYWIYNAVGKNWEKQNEWKMRDVRIRWNRRVKSSLKYEKSYKNLTAAILSRAVRKRLWRSRAAKVQKESVPPERRDERIVQVRLLRKVKEKLFEEMAREEITLSQKRRWTEKKIVSAPLFYKQCDFKSS
jgi:hypothetical protein